jgi:lipoprotein NlpD
VDSLEKAAYHGFSGFSGSVGLNRATIVFAIVMIFLVTACHRHARQGERWESETSTYQTTRDGYYRVRKGDTLHAIAFDYGMDWRDIASWNHIPSPYLIYPDQELRLLPPGQAATSGGSGKNTGVTTTGTQPRPTDRTASSDASTGSATTSGLKTPSSSTTTTAPARTPAPASTTAATAPASPATTTPSRKSSEPASSAPVGGDPSQWLWPTNGRVVSNFRENDPSRNGIEIAGDEGQPIVATAAGEVVYSGNGLIGYGELIIIKHSDRMLSAYAHNKQRLVSEGDRVSAGRKIAEMGRDERNKPLLHFEIRINGNPGNPLNYLPPR